jgi:hypothetical protein
MKNYDSLVDALNDLRKRGYTADFTTDTTCLYCGDLDMRLNPEEFKVDEIHRVESNSNPDDNAVIYAISSSVGVKGTLVDEAYSDQLTLEMPKKIQTQAAMAD